MLGWFRNSYGLKDNSDKLPAEMRRAIHRPVIVLICSCGAALFGVAVFLFSKPTDKAVATEALQNAALQVRYEMTLTDAPLDARQRMAALMIGADLELDGAEAKSAMTTLPEGANTRLRCRLSWAGEAPEFAGTRITAMNESGGEVAVLEVQDLAGMRWTIEEASPLLFWR